MESSTDKTKRNLIDVLTKYEWKYQTSIFVDVVNDELDVAKRHALEWVDEFDDNSFKTYLRKSQRDQAMLYVLRKTQHKNHPSKKYFPQFYITVFSQSSLGLNNERVNIYSTYLLNCIDRKLPINKIQSTCHAIKIQELHDLSSLGNKKRYTVLNKSKLKILQQDLKVG